MKREKLIIFFLLLLFSCISGKGYRLKKYSCVKTKILMEWDSNKEYAVVMMSFTDTLNDWIYKRKLKYYRSYPETVNMKVDSMILFNESCNRALLLLELQNKSSSCGNTDNVQTISAEKIHGVWHFYAISNPLFFYIRPKEIPTFQYSFEDLRRFTILRLMSDGLLSKSPGCKINSDYVDDDVKWFPAWMIKKHYSEFLNNK